MEIRNSLCAQGEEEVGEEGGGCRGKKRRKEKKEPAHR